MGFLAVVLSAMAVACLFAYVIEQTCNWEEF